MVAAIDKVSRDVAGSRLRDMPPVPSMAGGRAGCSQVRGRRTPHRHGKRGITPGGKRHHGCRSDRVSGEGGRPLRRRHRVTGKIAVMYDDHIAKSICVMKLYAQCKPITSRWTRAPPSHRRHPMPTHPGHSLGQRQIADPPATVAVALARVVFETRVSRLARSTRPDDFPRPPGRGVTGASSKRPCVASAPTEHPNLFALAPSSVESCSAHVWHARPALPAAGEAHGVRRIAVRCQHPDPLPNVNPRAHL